MRLNNIDSADFYQLLDDLKAKGWTPYVTGGTIRDYMMGDPKFTDIDLTIGTPITEIADYLKNYAVVPSLDNEVPNSYTQAPYIASIVEVGKAFGVIRLVLKDELSVDIAQFRADIYSEAEFGNHRPASVILVKTVEEDMARRDFTINSMAARYEGNREFTLVDPFNGLEDMRNKVIRAVGNQEERFREDPLRIMRAIRFAVRFGFTIEPHTFEAMKKLRGLVA